jgi:hypothetical protein
LRLRGAHPNWWRMPVATSNGLRLFDGSIELIIVMAPEA